MSQINEILNNQPPNAIDVEQVVIGALLVDTSAIKIVGDWLSDVDFYDQKNKIIYRAVKSLYSDGLPVDLITVYDAIQRIGVIDQIGGLNYLIELSGKVSSIANLEYHAKIVQEMAIRREIIADMAHYTALAFEGTLYASELISEIVGKLTDRNRVTERPKSLADSYLEVINMGEINGLQTGFRKLDDITNGLWGFVVLAAGPGEGKSVFALNIAQNVAKKGMPVLFVSLEMKAVEQIFRLIKIGRAHV